jgi:hypothetical protein
MKTCLLRLGAGVLLTIASTATLFAQKKIEFSANMQLLKGTGQTETVKLYVGNQRARFDRLDTAGGGRVGSLVIDFDHQFIFLLIPQSKVYLRIAGSLGTPFYEAAWMFRPYSSETPCAQWVQQADRRGIALRCQQAGTENVSGRTAQRWDATNPEGAHGSMWYDPELNFVTKVQRTSREGVKSGYEVQDIHQGSQPQKLFDLYKDYREFSVTGLVDVLTGVGQW